MIGTETDLCPVCDRLPVPTQRPPGRWCMCTVREAHAAAARWTPPHTPVEASEMDLLAALRAAGVPCMLAVVDVERQQYAERDGLYQGSVVRGVYAPTWAVRVVHAWALQRRTVLMGVLAPGLARVLADLMRGTDRLRALLGLLAMNDGTPDADVHVLGALCELLDTWDAELAPAAAQPAAHE
jgi:hypothetical protein